MAEHNQKPEYILTAHGAAITAAELDFILYMRSAAANGVGYGWMQQVAEWEWAHQHEKRFGIKDSGWGPMKLNRWSAEKDAVIAKLKTQVRNLKRKLKELRHA